MPLVTRALVLGPFETNAYRFGVRRSAPIHAGEHTREVLLELGYKAEEVEALARKAVVSGPNLPGKNASAGPFYLVWTGEKAQGIGPEQWPYMLASLAVGQSPSAHWPPFAVDRAPAPSAPARLGQALFVKHCFACHRMNGGGEATVGPDLNLPMNPVEYFQPQAVRDLLHGGFVISVHLTVRDVQIDLRGAQARVTEQAL